MRIRLLKLDPQVKMNKAVVMSYPIRMSVQLLKRHPFVEEATLCIRSKFKEEIRQVLMTLCGPLAPHLDLGNWGTFTFAHNTRNHCAASDASSSAITSPTAHVQQYAGSAPSTTPWNRA